jgi:hypothetical protein
VAQDAFPNGGSRGSVRLDQLTRAERRALATDFALRERQ